MRVAVFDNEIFDCGGGLFIQGNSTGSQNFCNLFEDCFTGLVFDDIDPGEYGEFISMTEYRMTGLVGTTVPTDDQFIGTNLNIFQTISAQLSDATTTTNLYHRTIPDYDYPMGSVLALGGLADEPDRIPSTIGAPCSPPMMSTTSGDNPIAFLELIDSLLTTNSTNAMPSYLYEYLQGAIKQVSEPDSLTLTILNTTNIIAIDSLVQPCTDTSQISAFQTALKSLVPINAIEENYIAVLKTKLSIDGRRLLDDIDTTALTTIELNVLDSIAFQLPFEVTLGSSILAQSIMDMTVVPDNWLVATMKQTSSLLENQLDVHPNPANTFVLVDQIPIDASCIMVVDLRGQVVLTKIISGSQDFLEISNLSSGFYLIVSDSPTSQKPAKLIVE